MLWLIHSQVSFAHALLVFYVFPIRDLEDSTFKEILLIIEFVVDNKYSLYCEALEAEAKRLSQAPFPLALHSLRTVSQLDEDAKKFLGVFSFVGDCLLSNFFYRAYCRLT